MFERLKRGMKGLGHGWNNSCPQEVLSLPESGW